MLRALLPLFVAAAVADAAWADPVDPDAVRLVSVQSLVFYAGGTTTGRRSAPIRQLQCASGCSATSQYPATAQCTNVGTGANGAPTWRCQMDLPAGVRLGWIEVSCEGFRASDDPYVLRGSCGLRYELLGGSSKAAADVAVFGYIVAGVAGVVLVVWLVWCCLVGLGALQRPGAASADPAVPTAIPVHSTDIEDPAAPVRVLPTAVHYVPAHTTFKSAYRPTYVSTGFGGTHVGGGATGFGGTSTR